MMRVPYDLSVYRSILCLNGSLPGSYFFEQINLPIVAADGAVNYLHAIHRIPQCVIGDLDSVSSEFREQYHCIHMPDQNQSDFQKTLVYLSQQALSPAIILGINGGYLDHILNNLNIFLETDHLFYAPPIWGRVLRAPSQIGLNLMPDTKISIMGIPGAEVSSCGLKWELARHRLSFPGNQACFNRSVQAQVVLEVHEGNALVLIYESSIQDAAI